MKNIIFYIGFMFQFPSCHSHVCSVGQCSMCCLPSCWWPLHQMRWFGSSRIRSYWVLSLFSFRPAKRQLSGWILNDGTDGIIIEGYITRNTNMSFKTCQTLESKNTSHFAGTPQYPSVSHVCGLDPPCWMMKPFKKENKFKWSGFVPGKIGLIKPLLFGVR